MSTQLSIGLVGAGVFGGYHAAKCAAHPRLDFVGLYDPDIARAHTVADTHGAAVFADYADLLENVDAVVIASPASRHGDMALQALKADCNVLIEKPIADTAAKAAEIIALATSRKRIVQVGHQERFVLKAIGLDQAGETPLRIVSHRHSPFSPRGTDVSVTLDLMTHDLDLVLWLMGDDPVTISGRSEIIKSGTPDAAFAILQFKAASARLEASRVEAESSRKMRITYPSGTVEIDFNAKRLTHNTPFKLNADFGNDPMAKDSLGAATNAFVEAVLDGKPVAITGGNGLRALQAALKVDGVI